MSQQVHVFELITFLPPPPPIIITPLQFIQPFPIEKKSFAANKDTT
jgi:hypothetical protein